MSATRHPSSQLSVSPSSSHPSSRPSCQPFGQPKGQPSAQPSMGLTVLSSSQTHAPSMPTSFPWTEFGAAPVMIALNVTATKTSIIVIMKLSSKGSMYCAVYALKVGYPIVAPSSQTEILLQNHVASTSNKNISTVTISSLSAVSNYSVYCLAVSPYNVMTPLSTVLVSVRVVETVCCKTVGVRLSSMNIITGQATHNFATIVLDSLPSSQLQVTFVVINTASKSVVAPALIPSTLTFTSSGALTKSLSMTSVSAGAYKIVATLSGASTKEYTVTFGGVTSTEHTYTVLIATASVPAPVLKSAVFASNGSFIAISFDSQTDQGNTSTVFTCSQLFNFTCAETSICKWADAGTSVIALVATSDRCAVPGSSLTLLSSAVIKAKCTAANGVCDTTAWPKTAAVSLKIQSPLIPVPPSNYNPKYDSD
eukprot:gene38195-47156_t